MISIKNIFSILIYLVFKPILPNVETNPNPNPSTPYEIRLNSLLLELLYKGT